jgi:signal peptidase II
MQRRGNATLFWPVVALVAALDVATKTIAVRTLAPARVPHPVLGETLRLTLVYNPGAAFGLNLGPQSRWIFTGLTLVALVILGRLYRGTAAGHLTRVTALAFVCAGAFGNLLDRLRSDLGVVDFIDVGFADARWPTFNVADMAVSVGAVLLAYVLWQEDRAAALPATAPLAGVGPADQGDVV